MNIQESIGTYIMSDCVDGLPQRSIAQNMFLPAKLRALGIGFVEMDGCYEGQLERSFLFKTDENTANRLALTYQQKCWVELSRNRGIGFVYTGDWAKPGKYEHLGQWTTSLDKPKDVKGWTFRPDLGLYMFVRS